MIYEGNGKNCWCHPLRSNPSSYTWLLGRHLCAVHTYRQPIGYTVKDIADKIWQSSYLLNRTSLKKREKSFLVKFYIEIFFASKKKKVHGLILNITATIKYFKCNRIDRKRTERDGTGRNETKLKETKRIKCDEKWLFGGEVGTWKSPVNLSNN